MEKSFIQSIVSIRDKVTHAEIPKSSVEIKELVAKYSNTKCPIYKLVLDGKSISRNNSLVVKYRCITCDILQEITLNLFLRKIQKDVRRCDGCKNKEEGKRVAQSQFMKQNMSSILAGEYEKGCEARVKDASLENHLRNSQSDWESEDDDFQNAYFLTHLTNADFDRIRARILDIGNGKITDLTGWNYEPLYRVYNQTRYTPMLVNASQNQVEKPLYISFRCENCDCKFTHRDLEVVKNKLKLLCKDCSLVNKTFRLRSYTLKSGEKILWQSNYERRFIEWCEEHSIPIQNGPKIPFSFQELQRTYRVDFLLPHHKKLLELKDNHCWHHQQVDSGLFAAKEKCANEWAQTNGYTFHVVFPKTLAEFKGTLCKI